MGWGILEPRANSSHVPGTAILLEDNRLSTETGGKTSDRVILVPKPSLSPNDPLNWPTWKKDIQLIALSLCLGLVAIQGTCLAVAVGIIAEEFEEPILTAETLLSYQFAACGVGAFVSALAARSIGKRPVYVLFVIIELVSCIWNAVGTSFHSLFWSRILYGFGAGPFEALVLSTIGDMYFLHQRGKRIATYNAIGLGLTQLSPVLGGYLTQTYGWRIQVKILSGFWALATLLVFFGCPETSFQRPLALETDIIANDSPQDSTTSSQSDNATKEKEAASRVTELSSSGDSNNQSLDTKRTYLQELLPIRGLESRANPLKLAVRLFTTALYPAVIWCFLIIGPYTAWFISITVTLAQIFQVPPISFDATRMGYLNTFCTPGAILAFVFTELLSDSSAKWFAKHNKRVYEPEFRLFLMIPAIIVGFPGFALFGWYNGHVSMTQHISWVVSSFFYGMIIYTVVNAQAVAYAYMLDAHRDISVESGVFAIMLRNFFCYGGATFVPRWLETSGIDGAFYWMSGLQGLFVLIPTILIYIFGKRIRSFYARHSPMRFLHVGVEHSL